MTDWPVERKWSIERSDSFIEIATAELTRYSGCVMLGAAGLGKTHEWRRLCNQERQTGLDVRSARLAELGVSAMSLDNRLRLLSGRPVQGTTIYLDALDECLIPLPQANLIVGAWLRELDPSVRLRLSCRSAVFAKTLEDLFKSRYPPDESCIAVLQPLTIDDTERIAVSLGLDGRRFVHDVQRAGAKTLASQPLTLDLLLDTFKADSAIPPTRHKLFEGGTLRLLRERPDRVEEGLAVDIPVPVLTQAAEELACLTILGARDTVYLGTGASPGALTSDEIHTARPSLTEDVLRALRHTGLFERAGQRTFRFVHRQFAEFLAGRRLANLLPHQSRALLASPAGWEKGPAGPLREVAAFAASYSTSIAEWVASADPEVVGLSDVAENGLRKRAVMELLAQLRSRTITDAQLRRGAIELRGLQYPGAADDFDDILRRAPRESPDVLSGVLEMVEAWGIDSLSERLADLVLDPAIPISVRKQASYSLARFGTIAARLRLKPLLGGVKEDRDEDLKGNALRALWPDHLATSELLKALTLPRRSNYGGAYSYFLYSLALSDFSAGDDIIKGLNWARGFITKDFDSDPLVRISRRIVREAVGIARHNRRVLEVVADLLLFASQQFSKSPLSPPKHDALGETESDRVPPAEMGDENRRALIEALIDRAEQTREVAWAVREYLLQPQDLVWFFQRASDASVSITRREQYADLARYVPFADEIAWVGAWLAVRENPLLGSRIPFALFCPLEGEDAEELKQLHQRSLQSPQQTPQRQVSVEYITSLLDKAEQDDPRFFIYICRALRTDSDDGGREITQTSVWRAADELLKDRMVDAATRLLETGDEEAVSSSDLSNTIPIGYMEAAWLLITEAPEWLKGRDASWWRLWCKYFLAHTHPNMMGERLEPKSALVALLYEKAPDTARDVICSVATSVNVGSQSDARMLLELVAPLADPSLDERLADALTRGVVPADRVRVVAEFVLRRDIRRGLAASVEQLQTSADDDAVVGAAVAMLTQDVVTAWPAVMPYLGKRPDLAPRILGEFASSIDRRSQAVPISSQIAGELVAALLEAFPPETDKDHTKAHAVTPDEEGRFLRDRLLNWLSEQADLGAVAVLKQLEQKYGAKYDWLSRYRAHAERALRNREVSPISPQVVANFLDASDKRLIRSLSDALDGVEESLRQYAVGLSTDRMRDRDDFWNRPRGHAPTPKEEERASDKVRDAIAKYFADYAVTSQREVQLYRRLSSSETEGRSGSEADVFTLVPAVGTTSGEQISIPIEVKFAHNPEARGALGDQLAGRYLPEAGTDGGVFVLIWIKNPGLHQRYTPLWPSMEAAEAALKAQAVQVAQSKPDSDIRVVIIDVSLPVRTLKTKQRVPKQSKVHGRSAKSQSGVAKLGLSSSGPSSTQHQKPIAARKRSKSGSGAGRKRNRK